MWNEEGKTEWWDKEWHGISAQVVREGLSNGMTLLFMKQRDNGKMVEENSRHSKQKIKMPWKKELGVFKWLKKKIFIGA